MRLVGAGERPPADRWRDQLIYARDGLRDCRENIVCLLQNHPSWKDVLAADVFAKRVVARRESPIGHKAGAVWTPDDDIQFGIWLAQQEGLVVRSEETIARSVAFVAKASEIHPVREYLRSLVWDNESRIDSWTCRYLGAAETTYSNLVGRYFLLNLVRRAFEPGCVMRSLPVLEGPQNIGKSTVGRVLAEPWFSDTPFDLGNLKDVYLVIQGVWLYEVAELDSFSKFDATRVKAFVSSTKDRFRAPYDRAPQDQPRETCFIATTNAQEYLKDWTGNTRFHPLACAKIDLAALAAMRDQLLAEALVIYREGGDGARAFPTREEEERHFLPEQEARLSVHPWFYIVSDWLNEHRNIEVTTVTELIREALHIAISDMGRNTAAEHIVGRTMAKLGWERRRDPQPDRGGVRAWRWHRPEVKPEKVNPDEVPF